MKFFVLCAFFSVLGLNTSHALEAVNHVDAHGKSVLLLKGDVNSGDDQKIIPVLAKTSQREVWLQSGGGDTKAGVLIGKALRKYQKITRIPADAFCGSACVDIFMGGLIRFVDKGARVAIHPASMTDTGATEMMQNFVKHGKAREGLQALEQYSTHTTAEWMEYISFMGVSKEIVRYAATVPHDCYIELSEKELVFFNLINTKGAPAKNYQPGDGKKVCK